MNNSKTTDDCKCDLHQFERNRYFYGKLMTVRDFETEQGYHREHRHLHNHSLHGQGVVCGLGVEAKGGAGNETKVVVSPGLALDCCGREIVVASSQEVDLKDFQAQIGDVAAAGKTVYLCIKYDECGREPVPALENASTCEEVCEHNRISEKAAFEVLTELTPEADSPFCDTWMDLNSPEDEIQRQLFEQKFKTCLHSVKGPSRQCVILARVTLEPEEGQSLFRIKANGIDNVILGPGIHRQFVYPTPLVVELLECLKKKKLEVKDENTPVVSAAQSLNFLGGIYAVDGGAGQANVSANVANGLKIVGDQIQPDYATTATAGKVCQANDPRLSNARTPSAHAASHQADGADPINVTKLPGVLAEPQRVLVQREGHAVNERAVLNFKGAGVTATDNAGAKSIDITVPGGAASRIFFGKVTVTFDDKDNVNPASVNVKELKDGEPFAVILAPQLLADTMPIFREPFNKKQGGPHFVFGATTQFERIFAAFVPRPYHGTFEIHGSVGKFKHGKSMEIIFWVIAGGQEVQPVVSSIRDRILDFLRNNPNFTLTRIADDLGIARAEVELELNRLIEENLARRDNRGRFILLEP